MTKLVLAVAAASMFASLASAAPMPRMPADFETWLCVIIKVRPPDRDRDPGFKINLMITPDSFSDTHTTISGAAALSYATQRRAPSLPCTGP